MINKARRRWSFRKINKLRHTRWRQILAIRNNRFKRIPPKMFIIFQILQSIHVCILEKKKPEIYSNKNWAYINIEIRQFQFIFCIYRQGMISISKRNDTAIAGRTAGNFLVYRLVHYRIYGCACVFANIVRIKWHAR